MARTRSQSPRIRLAGVLVRQGKILVVEHARAGRNYYLLPGGGLEWGETCSQGLAREFKEELSLKITVGPLLFVNESIAPHGQRHILNLTFLIRSSQGRMALHPDRRLRGMRWVTPKELTQLVFYPEIRAELLRAWKAHFRSRIQLIPTPWN